VRQNQHQSLRSKHRTLAGVDARVHPWRPCTGEPCGASIASVAANSRLDAPAPLTRCTVSQMTSTEKKAEAKDPAGRSALLVFAKASLSAALENAILSFLTVDTWGELAMLSKAMNAGMVGVFTSATAITFAGAEELLALQLQPMTRAQTLQQPSLRCLSAGWLSWRSPQRRFHRPACQRSHAERCHPALAVASIVDQLATRALHGGEIVPASGAH
jgi:hypothetical protein